MIRRLPIDSPQPVVLFCAVRLGLVAGSLLATGVAGLPYDGRLAAALGLLGLPWALGVLVLARRHPSAAVSPLVAAGDLLVLGALELIVPSTYGAVRFAALFLIAAHAHFQGERVGLAAALLGSALLIGAGAIVGAPVEGRLLAFYEGVFAIAAISVALLLGRLRATESASRVRARDLTRRTISDESEARRRLADALHEGPVQELIALDMTLAAVDRALTREDSERAGELLAEARESLSHNVGTLRDEIVDLGPYAFDELSFGTAVEDCAAVWRRRYRMDVLLTLEPLDLSSAVANGLFRITQEAVVNAGRHARPTTVSVSLRQMGGGIELRVSDDGRGFGGVDPLGPAEAGHLGLASMRERAALLGGELTIESSTRGTRIVVSAPAADGGA